MDKDIGLIVGELTDVAAITAEDIGPVSTVKHRFTSTDPIILARDQTGTYFAYQRAGEEVHRAALVKTDPNILRILTKKLFSVSRLKTDKDTPDQHDFL